jgi:hypothetical protein
MQPQLQKAVGLLNIPEGFIGRWQKGVSPHDGAITEGLWTCWCFVMSSKDREGDVDRVSFVHANEATTREAVKLEHDWTSNNGKREVEITLYKHADSWSEYYLGVKPTRLSGFEAYVEQANIIFLKDYVQDTVIISMSRGQLISSLASSRAADFSPPQLYNHPDAVRLLGYSNFEGLASTFFGGAPTLSLNPLIHDGEEFTVADLPLSADSEKLLPFPLDRIGPITFVEILKEIDKNTINHNLGIAHAPMPVRMKYLQRMAGAYACMVKQPDLIPGEHFAWYDAIARLQPTEVPSHETRSKEIIELESLPPASGQFPVGTFFNPTGWLKPLTGMLLAASSDKDSPMLQNLAVLSLMVSPFVLYFVIRHCVNSYNRVENKEQIFNPVKPGKFE